MAFRSLRFLIPLSILAFMAGILVSTARRTSLVYDEVIYAPVGVLYWKTGNFRWNNEHPPLQKLVSALPLLSQPIAIPENLDPARDDVWRVGHRIFFQSANPLKLIFAARAPTIVVTLCLGAMVFGWTAQLAGFGAGVLALLLFSFDPLVLGNGALAMNDMFVTLFFFGAVATFLSGRAGWAGALAGCAIASKFSGLLILPAFFLARRRRRDAYVAAAVALAVVLAFYRFDPRLLMAALRSETSVHQSRASMGYLLGPIPAHATWYYYPVAAFIKTPLPILAAWLSALFMVWRKKAELAPWRPVLVPVALVWLAAMVSRNHFGVRYLLPATPLLACLAGAAYAHLPKRLERFAAWALAGWLMLEGAATHPHHLAYFNELVGGPSHGYKWLDGSNQDWGQDLPTLATYLERHGQNAAVFMGYWGSNDPAAWGIQYQDVFSPAIVNRFRKDVANPVEAERELLVVSATLRQNPTTEAIYGWLYDRVPVAFLGGTIFVYDITNDLESVVRLRDLYRDMGRTALAQRQQKRLELLELRMGSALPPAA